MPCANIQTIRCGYCDAPVRSHVAGDADSLLGCLACDNWGSTTEVMRIVDEYVSERVNRRGKPVSGKAAPHRHYRFIADGKF